MGLTVRSERSAPNSPFLLVSNHLSYVDVVVLASQLDCAFIAKADVAGWPVLGFICRTMNTIFINRGRRRSIPGVIAEINDTMYRGLGVVLFAEGTSSGGEKVLPFRSSLLEAAARDRIPVHYASINYVTPDGEPGADRVVCWWGEMTFPDHLFRLLQLPSFQATLVFGSEPIVADDRRILAARLWSAVSTQVHATAGQA